MNKNEISFMELGLSEKLCAVCKDLGLIIPTPIQRETIPLALQGKDIIGLAETGSGKTAAFALPIMNHLLTNRTFRFFALVLAPTRELAVQIKDSFDDLGKSFGLQVCLIVGGVPIVKQAIEIAKHPHIIVATPGRLVDLLHKTKGFNLLAFRYLVLDEADRILDLGFEDEVDEIIKALPATRKTMLFSATMTYKVKRLKRAHLKNVSRIEISTKFTTPDSLKQFMVHIDLLSGIDKNMHLHYILNKFKEQSMIIFCSSCPKTLKISTMIRRLNYKCVPLNGNMNQELRLKALEKFRTGKRAILVATDIASRGLDIPDVDLVINYDIPLKSKVYIHRVGRTARAGKEGTAITFVSMGDINSFKNIENDLGFKQPNLMQPFVNEEDMESVMELKAVVAEANRLANAECREKAFKLVTKKKRKIIDDEDDTEENLGFRKKLNKK